jgi:hypothetical protein
MLAEVVHTKYTGKSVILVRYASAAVYDTACQAWNSSSSEKCLTTNGMSCTIFLKSVPYSDPDRLTMSVPLSLVKTSPSVDSTHSSRPSICFFFEEDLILSIVWRHQYFTTPSRCETRGFTEWCPTRVWRVGEQWPLGGPGITTGKGGNRE